MKNHIFQFSQNQDSFQLQEFVDNHIDLFTLSIIKFIIITYYYKFIQTDKWTHVISMVLVVLLKAYPVFQVHKAFLLFVSECEPAVSAFWDLIPETQFSTLFSWAQKRRPMGLE